MHVLGFSETDRVGHVTGALERLLSKRYGLVLADIHIEPQDGFDLLQKVRSDPSMSTLSFIFVTGEISAELWKERVWRATSGYILKTVGPCDMMESIRDALNAGPDAPFCIPTTFHRLPAAEQLLFMRAMGRTAEEQYPSPGPNFVALR